MWHLPAPLLASLRPTERQEDEGAISDGGEPSSEQGLLCKSKRMGKMRKQFLYVDKAGYYYKAPGNIAIGAGSQGTVFFWYHPANWNGTNQPIWEAVFDDNNLLRLRFSGATQLSFECYVNGTRYAVNWSNFLINNYQKWLPVACTWDFTTPGAGKLRLYIDGQEAPMRVDNAQAPAGEAIRFYLGARPGTTASGLDGHLDNVCIWNGVMSGAQYQALTMNASTYAQRQNARRRVPRPSDGTGTMTFLATFDGRYDADYAAGDPRAYWLVDPPDYHHFARIDDGARSRGQRYAFRFGLPRHDNSEDDRVPLRAVLDLIRYQNANQYTTLIDRDGYSEINISQLKPLANQGQGVGWLRPAIDPNHLQRPATVHLRVNLPDSTNPKNTKITLGPVTYISGGMHGSNFSTWGTGEAFSVVADAGNSPSSFKTNLTARSDNYWQGAEVSFRTGACAGCRLKVLAFNASTRVLTLSGALPATPAAGDMGVVDFRGRLIGTNYPFDETQSLEAWLWEEYGEDRPWIEIEAVYGPVPGTSFVRYQRGRTAWLNMTTQRGDEQGRGLMFGRSGWELPSSFSCNILLESLIIEGPGSYQMLSPTDSRLRRGFELGDTFMLRDMNNEQSCRVWRAVNCVWAAATPTVNPDPNQARVDLQAGGTWRHSVTYYRSLAPWPETETIVALVQGTDPFGVKRLGYVRGRWNAEGTRIVWEEEPAPLGRSNPFMASQLLRPWETSDSQWGLNSDPSQIQIFQTPDGNWSLLVLGTEDNPDHYWARALHGAPDRWSFHPDLHWWAHNPLLPGFGGVDMMPPQFGGFNCFGNRDAEWIVCYNPWARETGRRFLGYARFKTILPLGTEIGANRRPTAGWRSPDLKSFFLLPHGTSLSPLPMGEVFTLCPFALSDDFTGLLVLFYGDVIRLLASDDDQHYQEVVYAFMPNGTPRDVFRLGNRRVYYYILSSQINYAYLGYNRETYYQLSSNQTSGYIDTAILLKPSTGWQDLVLNVASEQGAVLVEVLDPGTDEPLPGYTQSDCDSLSEGLEQVVTWKNRSLAQLTAEAIRLRFYLQRANAAHASPKLYSWHIKRPESPLRPQATGLRVEGRVNPAHITDRTPTFSWTYSDPQGRPQIAYHILVASSAEKLAANEGDLWDSGVQLGSQTAVTYGGRNLTDRTTYFWKVRVQNAAGIWSEDL